jgi:hypothetical protein
MVKFDFILIIGNIAYLIRSNFLLIQFLMMVAKQPQYIFYTWHNLFFNLSFPNFVITDAFNEIVFQLAYPQSILYEK